MYIYGKKVRATNPPEKVRFLEITQLSVVIYIEKKRKRRNAIETHTEKMCVCECVCVCV